MTAHVVVNGTDDSVDGLNEHLVGRPGAPVNVSPEDGGIVLLRDPDMTTGGHSFSALNTTSGLNSTNGYGQIHSFTGAINDDSNRTTQDSIETPGKSGSSRAPPPIAIVGIGMRLPGGVNDEGAFWDMLINKRNGRGVVPADRYNVDAFYSADGEPGTVKTKHGYFLDHVNLQHLDASFFSMNKTELEKLDPQQRLLLEVVWECMENGAQVGWRGKKIGCYVGVFGEDWLDMAAKDTQYLGMYRITGCGDFAISNRVSYEYDFKGPSMTIRTGCSSSLIGLHEACQAIYSGECDSAVVAGTNLIISPSMTIAMTEQGVLSSSGMCNTFDAKADGYARGEAVNAIYVKPLSDAIRDGDPIRAVIRSTATNCDGKTPGMACPSSESHESLMRRAYQVAHLPDLSKTAYVECHGTATAVGDPLETAAVANVFGRNGLFIGSVKPNVGHSEGASGITSLIKTVLALEHKTIPPNINFNEPNPKIPFEKARLYVPLEATAWPENRERASVNSFGIGGANAHVVVDSAASFCMELCDAPTTTSSPNHPQLLVFSAHHPHSLRRSEENYRRFVASQPCLIKDLAYTLGARRVHLSYRSFCVTDGKRDIETSSSIKYKPSPQVAFVFTGQGAQWAGMGNSLFKNFPDFRYSIRVLDTVLAGLPLPPSWSIEDELARDKDMSRIDEAEFSQPLCTALQIGVVNLLRSWGVSPAAVVGHSSGEIAAAYATKALSAKAAIIIAYYRGQISKKQSCSGSMLAVGMGRESVTPYLIEGVVLACENSPESVTLSGDYEQVKKVAEHITDNKPKMFVRHLKVEVAYHSHHMMRSGPDYQALLEGYVSTQEMDVPLFSSVTGNSITNPKQLGSLYWRQNLELPVLFYSATRSMLGQLPPDSILLEIGPHSALAGPLRQIFKALGHERLPVYVPSLTRGQDSTRDILAAIGQLHTLGVSINFEKVTTGQRILTGLPTYPWRHETTYWNESRPTREWRKRRFRKHELLGSRILEGNELEPTWRNILLLEDVIWLRDHKIIEDIVFPAAGYICMAGAAVQQLTSTTDFTLRQVLIKTALVLQESTSTEMMTSLRPVQVTTALDSNWYEFMISSFNGTSWTRNCVGHVRAGREQPSMVEHIDTLPRDVVASSWYAALKRVGFNYGPCFRKLSDISAGPNCGTSVAGLIDQFRTPSFLYQLHPTTIDSCLQLFTVAMSEGTSRHLQKLCVPTEIEELYVCQGEPQIRVKVTASSLSKEGAVVGNATAMAGNEVVLQLKGSRFSLLNDGGRTKYDGDPFAGAQLQWKPDINFIPAQKLMRPRVSFKDEIVKLEMLALLCILETHHEISGLETKVDHLKRFQAWLAVQVERARTGNYTLIEEAQEISRMSHEERLTTIATMSREVAMGVGAEIGQILLRIRGQCKAIFAQEVDSVDVLMQKDGLKVLYGFYQDMWDCREFYELLGHEKPSQRILEIGAGTGGTTAGVLKDLTMPSGERMYSEYCYTDISAGFFIAAKERFKAYQYLQYAVLDISKDPIEQGFIPESYDLILASNVLHATPNIQSTLRNVRKLLNPGGRLLIQELTPTVRKFNYIMGILPSWWLGESDNRSLEPYIPVQRWDQELRAAGFSGADSAVYDDDYPYQINVNILSRPARTTPYPKGVTILGDEELDPIAQKAEAILVSRGYRVDRRTINQVPAPNQTIVSLLDLSYPFLDGISADRWNVFQHYLRDLGSSGILWATRSSQLSCKDPRYSQILGAARTIRSELLIDFATFEIDTVNDFSLEALANVLLRFDERTKSPELDCDWEYALFEQMIYIPRYRWISVAEQLSAIQKEELPRKLEMGTQGSWQSLRWVQGSPIILKHDEMEVETRAVGLNFKDVLVCMGVVDATKAGIGLEGAGIVRSVGSGVKDFRSGDRVLMFEHGCFSTRMTISAKACAKIPDELSFEEAATMPCVYSTVIHSLLTLGRLERDQTVLIQSACGGVGLAAIQICRAIGAQIFATVGNDEKAEHLVKTFGIPPQRIFNSRNSSFLAHLMRETNGRGVDIVLNSLSGELLHASWKCVAEYGKMLEIGKRDFIGRGRLSMDLFEANRAFFGIDMARLAVERPEACRSILEQCMDLYRQGAIAPIAPITTFDAIQIGDGFKFLQKGQHIGKIVASMPRHPQELDVTAVKQELRLRPEASYLLVGGLGGLGKSIATWMVEHGARYLLFLSRSAGKSDTDHSFLNELRTQGCSAQAICGSVTCLEDVEKAVNSAVVPLAGVMHLSMVLEDRAFLDFTLDEWHAALAPKVEGTWNLHNALIGIKLDFFVLFSSISCIVGQWGQGNYAAANTFLDSFVQFRHSLGQPASVLDIGVMEDVGYVSQNPAVLEQFKAANAHTLREQDLMDALHLEMTRSTAPPPSTAGYANPSQLVIGLRSTKPLSDPSNRAIWKRDVRMSLYRNMEHSTGANSGATSEDLKPFLAAVAIDPMMLNEQKNKDFLTNKIKVCLCNFMLRSEEDVDVAQSLMGLGLDSLVAIEIRNWWRQHLGLEISVLEIMNAGSIQSLGNVALTALQRKSTLVLEREEDTYLLMKAP